MPAKPLLPLHTIYVPLAMIPGRWGNYQWSVLTGGHDAGALSASNLSRKQEKYWRSYNDSRGAVIRWVREKFGVENGHAATAKGRPDARVWVNRSGKWRIQFIVSARYEKPVWK